MGNRYVDGTALTIVIIGAINWLLIGLFRFDLVAFLFGDMSWLSSWHKKSPPQLRVPVRQ